MALKVLLVLPIREGHNFLITPDLGILYLGTALRRQGFDVTLLDCPKEKFSFVDFRKFLEGRKFDVVGIRCFSRDHNYVNHHLKIVRQVSPDALTLVGGPHPSALPEFVLGAMPGLDFAWKCEAEESLPELLSLYSEFGREIPEELLDKVPGLCWRSKTREAVVTNPGSFSDDLDSFGVPAWELLEPGSYPGFAWGEHYPIITTRGCPYPCTYCNVPRISGKKLRHRSVENVVEELRLLRSRFRASRFSIMDDEFTLDRDYATQLCEALIDSGLQMAFDCPLGVRLDSLTPDLVKLMDRAGCKAIAVGIESGSRRVQKDIKKKVSLDTIREKAEMVAQSSRIAMVGYFMLGFKDETEEEIRETIELALDLPLARANFNIVIPIPGTAIFDDCVREGRVSLDQINWDDFTSDQISFAREHVSGEKLLELQKEAYMRFYRQPRIIWDLTKQTLGHRAVVHVILRRLKMLFSRETARNSKPLYLREAGI